jgi:cation diffusion facilitator CzcD-associated flavoprotein CzcO
MVRVAVLGAGPTGLEAALAAHQRGWEVVVYEAAPHVGGYVRRWGQVRLFTPWAMDVSPRTAALLDVADPQSCPTGDELATHLDRVAALLPDVRLSTRVEQVARRGLLKNQEIGTPARAGASFLLLVTGPDGSESLERADVVLDCTGTYGHPNPTGDGGIPAPGERACADRIVRQIPRVDSSWAGRRVLLVGAGFSAQTAARDLVAAGVELVWAVRRERPGWGDVPDDPLPARRALVQSSQALAGAGVLRAGVVVQELRRTGDGVGVVLRGTDGRLEQVVVDVVVSLTGAVGDSSIYRQLQVHECYATEGPIALAATLLGGQGGDCLAQTSAGVDVLRNPEPGFFVLGSKSYGRTSTFLLRVGWEQVAEVFAALDEELLAAV